jgi:hypothetical protein
VCVTCQLLICLGLHDSAAFELQYQQLFIGTVAVQDLPTEGGEGPIPVLPVPNISQDAGLDPVLVHLCQGENGLIPDLQTGVDDTTPGLLPLAPGKVADHLIEGIIIHTCSQALSQQWLCCRSCSYARQSLYSTCSYMYICSEMSVDVTMATSYIVHHFSNQYVEFHPLPHTLHVPYTQSH